VFCTLTVRLTPIGQTGCAPFPHKAPHPGCVSLEWDTQAAGPTPFHSREYNSAVRQLGAYAAALCGFPVTPSRNWRRCVLTAGGPGRTMLKPRLAPSALRSKRLPTKDKMNSPDSAPASLLHFRFLYLVRAPLTATVRCGPPITGAQQAAQISNTVQRSRGQSLQGLSGLR
jgi:hypothetical protein